MTHFFQRSALLLLASTALCVAAPADAATKRKTPAVSATYTVKSGDNLDRISKRLGVTVDELKAANGLKSNALQPGDKLKNPKAEAPAKAAPRAATAKGKAASKGSAPADEPVETATYTVRHGDTLFSIAQSKHVSVADLRKANGLSGKAVIHTGEVLKLSAEAAEPPARTPTRNGRTAPPPASSDDNDPISDRAAAGRVINVPGKATTYKVRKGDNLARVADKLNTDVAQLKRDNRLKGTTIHAGQMLKGPRATAKAYVAASGDTLATVAERFGVTTARLRAENGLSRTASIRAGQRLRLPAGYRDGGPIRSAPGREPPTYPPARLPVPGPDYPVRTAPNTDPQGLPSAPQPYTGTAIPRLPNEQRGGGPNPPTAAPVAAPPPTDAQVSQMGRGKFTWPVRGQLLSDFGPKPTGQKNDGINIQSPAGEPVRVAADGDVVYAGDQVPGFGNLVLVKHADGWVTAYGHLSHVDVKMQQKVTQGQQIGQVGSTGGVPEPQLHFEVRYAPNPLERARPIDPKLVLPPAN